MSASTRRPPNGLTEQEWRTLKNIRALMHKWERSRDDRDLFAAGEAAKAFIRGNKSRARRRLYALHNIKAVGEAMVAVTRPRTIHRQEKDDDRA